ncbi:unnamed protein product [Prorocentrum cordatum]|uniref:Uncharacterized protein n=1 Tax=Prorocentrum cordatum TaxID=2364126 RepID=A0ABN9S9B3_9DINO|nr:unnamed protein product [Polarella glacialis]
MGADEGVIRGGPAGAAAAARRCGACGGLGALAASSGRSTARGSPSVSRSGRQRSPTAAAYQVRLITAVTERLRRAGPRGSLRHAKHVYHLSLLNAMPRAAADWGEVIHARLGGLLQGGNILEAHAFLPLSVPGALRDSRAKGSDSVARKKEPGVRRGRILER